MFSRPITRHLANLRSTMKQEEKETLFSWCMQESCWRNAILATSFRPICVPELFCWSSVPSFFQTVKVPSALFSHHVECVQSKLYTRSRLANGGDAGEFKDVGKVGKPHICTRLCCENNDCDLSYMFGRNCFLVKCYSEESCRVIPDEDLQINPNDKSERRGIEFDKQVQYIVKRKFGVVLRPGKLSLLLLPLIFIYHSR